MTTGTEYHPDYVDALEDWELIRDTLIGERAVKEAGEVHLPMPSGFAAEEDKGSKLYRMYQKRARFGEYVLPTVSGMVGVIHSTEEKMKIEVPPQLEYLWEDADREDSPLEAFHQKLTEGLLAYGRVGVQVTAPKDGGEPYLTLWKAPKIINWDKDFVILDDAQWVRQGRTWVWKEYRRIIERREDGVFSTLYDGAAPIEDGESEIRSVNGVLQNFPFIIVNANGVSLDLTPPPVLGVARAAIAEYQLSADYRWQLYMSGQETLFVINAEAPSAVGAGVVVELIGETEGKQPDAKYVGPSGKGIDAHRVAMEEERLKAVAAGAKLLQFEGKTAESGDALRTRFRTHTATLVGVAQASCRGLERALRVAGELKGLSPEAINKITVTPPKDLSDMTMTAAEAKTMVEVWQQEGFSKQTLFENLQRGNLINPDRSFEDEEKLIEEENFGQNNNRDPGNGNPPPIVV